MTREQIIEQLKDILVSADASNADKIEKCTEDASLVSDLGFSSVNILYMVIAIEEVFGIRFENVSVSDFETLSDVVDYIEKKRG